MDALQQQTIAPEGRALERYLDKLERRGRLPDRERDMLRALPGTYRDYDSNETIVASDAPAKHCVIIDKGFVSRVRTIGKDTKQIVAFHLPGDAVDLQSLLFSMTDHSIVTHAPTRAFWVAHEDIWNLTDRSPILAKALWLDTLVDASIFREWTANIGQRRARERIAHLFLELAARFEAIGLLRGETFPCPPSQTALASALGLSLVHFNKSLQTLLKDGYLSTKQGVTLHRRADLAAFANFDDSYLHLDGSRTADVEIASEA